MPKKRVRKSSKQDDVVPRSSQRKKSKKSPVNPVEEELVSLLPSRRKKAKQSSVNSDDACFVGEPIPADETQKKWPHRYTKNE